MVLKLSFEGAPDAVGAVRPVLNHSTIPYVGDVLGPPNKSPSGLCGCTEGVAEGTSRTVDEDMDVLGGGVSLFGSHQVDGMANLGMKAFIVFDDANRPVVVEVNQGEVELRCVIQNLFDRHCRLVVEGFRHGDEAMVGGYVTHGVGV